MKKAGKKAPDKHVMNCPRCGGTGKIFVRFGSSKRTRRNTRAIYRKCTFCKGKGRMRFVPVRD